MNRMDKHLDELFANARAQAPEASFVETVAQFNATIGAVGGGTAMATWVAKLISLNGGLVLTGVLVISAILISISADTELQDNDQGIAQSIHTETQQPTEVRVVLPMIKPRVDKDSGKLMPGTGNTNKKVNPGLIKKSIGQTGRVRMNSSAFLLPQKTKAILPPQPIKYWAIGKIPTVPWSADGKSNGFLFTLTDSSSEADFKRIEELARAAGIDFYSHVHRFRSRRHKRSPQISDFVVNMTINETGVTSAINVNVSKGGKFEVTFGWYVNEDGKVVMLTEDITINEAASKHCKR